MKRIWLWLSGLGLVFAAGWAAFWSLHKMVNATAVNMQLVTRAKEDLARQRRDLAARKAMRVVELHNYRLEQQREAMEAAQNALRDHHDDSA